jgi:rhamnosyltransferase subunit B
MGAAGSHGDVLPFIALARQLQRRGHEPKLYSDITFEPLARAAGVPFTSSGTNELAHSLLRDPDLIHPARAIPKLSAAFAPYLQPAYEAMVADIVPGNTIVIGSTLAFVARSLAEAQRLPIAVVHLSPAIFRTVHRLPRVSAISPWQGAPRFLKRAFWYLVDALVFDPSMGAVVNRHRVEVGLKPVRRVLDNWIHQADIVIGMFPQWFAEPQPDWPEGLRLTGFPLADLGDTQSLPADVEAFLAEGESPVAFTAGTATAAAHAFYATSAEACRRSGRRGILLTPHADQVTAPLPHGVVRFDHVPFRLLLPRLAAFVHHGGIGTLSQAFRAGVPQLIRPMAHDQFDNSARAQRLGVALELLPKRYSVDAVIEALDRLTRDPVIRERCRELAPRVEGDGISKACDQILEICGAAEPG